MTSDSPLTKTSDWNSGPGDASGSYATPGHPAAGCADASPTAGFTVGEPEGEADGVAEAPHPDAAARTTARHAVRRLRRRISAGMGHLRVQITSRPRKAAAPCETNR